jgi:HD-like signal output (HDOD) protein
MFRFLGRSARKKDPKKALQSVLGDYALPSFSSVVLGALEKLRDPEATPASVGDALAADPGLSVRLLATVNSAAYALRREVRSIEHAIALLGIPTVESLVLSAAVRDAIPTKAQPGYESERFWRAAARRAATARGLAGVLHPASASESFTVALLQDMAVPFLATSLSDHYGPVLETWHLSGESLADLEQEEFGWDHAEIGNWLGLEWGLPESLATAIGGHHGAVNEETGELESPPAVYLVSFIGETKENLGIDRLLETAEAEYGLAPDQVKPLVEKGFESAEELASSFIGS